MSAPSREAETDKGLPNDQGTAGDVQQPQQPLFPFDFTNINRYGFRLGHHSYCFYRVFMLTVATSLFTLLLLYGPELKYHQPQIRNFAYLTYWGFTASLLYFFVGAVESILIRALGPALNISVWKFLHFLYMNLLGVEIMINGVFWFVFFPAILHYHHQSGVPFNVQDMLQAIGAHLVPLLMLLIDGTQNLVCFWNRHPRRYLVTVLLVYLGFNMVYTLEMGPIYPVMTYKDYLTYVFVAGNVVGAYVCYEIMFFVSRKLKNERVYTLLTSTDTSSRTQNIKTLQTDAPNTDGVMHRPLVQQANNEVDRGPSTRPEFTSA